MTLGQRAHNVYPYGLYGENACFNMCLSVFCLPVRDPIPIFILIFYYIKD